MNESKKINKHNVGVMFDAIAWRYDFLNHFLTLGIDVWWRKKAMQWINKKPGMVILDVATGTADLAIGLAKHLAPFQIIGIDISDGMLEYGMKKIEKLELTDQILLQHGNGEELDFPDESFDVVTIGFGIRNFVDPEKGLSEIFRVLKSGGELVILEFSRPKYRLITSLFDLYFCYILPWIGKIFSKHATAYTYLPNSVQAFPYGKTFEAMLQQAGFIKTAFKPLTLGIVTLYKGVKPPVVSQ
ncbi:MAG: bifunctional demethylmenaquinone methyltransferase/2-methoxy-6-polyprenyl-1,4-benzoquinol methylase UbiE [Microbacter sp.]